MYIHTVKVLEKSYSIEVWGWGDGSVSEGLAVQAWDLSSVPRTLVKKPCAGCTGLQSSHGRSGESWIPGV